MTTETSPHSLQTITAAARRGLTDPAFCPATWATRVGLSERTLYRRMRELTGQTPAAYLRALRLEKARRLLLTGVCPSVADVARRTGFGNADYFGQVYARCFGSKPSEDRRHRAQQS